MKTFAMLPLIFFAATAQAQPVKITGETTYEPHKLVRLKAEGAPARSLLTWTVEPTTTVEYPSLLADDKLEFNAEPGVYTVSLTVDWRTPQGMQTQTASVKVTLKGCSEQAPPPRPEPPKIDPMAAIARINFDGAGCTAAAIWPRRPDGRWDIYTAAHCLSRVGQKGRLALKDGRILPVTVTVLDRGSDAAWLVTDESIPNMPYLHLARENPVAGTRLWHAGFGWEQPGNREEGEVATQRLADGKIAFNISLSQGDSGGPIMRIDNNEVIASACCTTRIAAKALAFGGSCETAWRLRPVVKTNVQDDPKAWAPASMPIVDKGGHALVADTSFDWKPAPIPLAEVGKNGLPIMKDKHK